MDDGERKIRMGIYSDLVVNGRRADGLWIAPGAKRAMEIKLNGLADAYDMRQAVLHEIIHAAEYTEGFEIPDLVVDAIARYLTRIFRHNKQVVRFFLKKF